MRMSLFDLLYRRYFQIGPISSIRLNYFHRGCSKNIKRLFDYFILRIGNICLTPSENPGQQPDSIKSRCKINRKKGHCRATPLFHL
jgi:hypothetical protein